MRFLLSLGWESILFLKGLRLRQWRILELQTGAPSSIGSGHVTVGLFSLLDSERFKAMTLSCPLIP